jgi:DNA polymerase (family 10)
VPVHNADIGSIFEEIADLLEIQGGNPFRIRAYRNAARTVGEYHRDLKTLLDRGDALPKLPGVGADLEGKIREICASGTCELLERLHREMPAAITELLRIPGLGPKRVRLLHDALEIDTLEQLRRAVRSGMVRGVPGFGEKTEAQIVQALERRDSAGQRVKLAVAAQYAGTLVAHLDRAPGVAEVVVAGSFRRRRDTVGDLDVLVAAARAAPVMERLRAYDEVKTVLAAGKTRSSVVLRSGLQVDVRVVPRASFGAALHYFTGSRAHNIAIRRIARARGLKINEYGVFRGTTRVAGETEESVYRAVGLPFIPPELREDRGEIEAARRGELPHLLARSDLKGDLHLHTRATDGHDSIRTMALAARAAGLTYIAVTEHSRRLTVAHGLDPRGVAKQIDEIDRINGALSGVTILKGIEVDILDDGSLDLPDAILKRLDIVVGAVHGAFNLPRRRQTERILRAMDNPYFNVLAHPGGRLLGEREGCELDMLRIVRRAKRNRCYLELNAQPDRLDLDDVHCRMARDEGVLVAIDSDAHGVNDFAHLEYGVGQARRGWLEPADVLNTRALPELRVLLSRSASG